MDRATYSQGMRAMRRPVSAVVTVDLGEGKTMTMAMERPHIEVDYENRYDDVTSFGMIGPIRYVSREATVTLRGYLADPGTLLDRKRPKPRRPPAGPPSATPEPAAPAGPEWVGTPPPPLKMLDL